MGSVTPDSRATAVFDGSVLVAPDAQKTSAQQENRNLLLSDEATVNTKPVLEINADDVKCSHGSTVGQLDTEALFYLRSRGIGAREARNLLIHGFVRELVDGLRVAGLKSSLSERLEACLPDAAGRQGDQS